MTDFHAQLEEQLLEAARRRVAGGPHVRWRGAVAGRGRRSLAVASIALVIVASVLLAPGLRSGSAPGPGGAAGPSTPPATPSPVTPGARFTVSIFNGTPRSGVARAVATALERSHGDVITIQALANAPDQTQQQTIVSYRPGARRQGELVATTLGGVPLRPMTTRELTLEPRATVIVVVGSDFAMP